MKISFCRVMLAVFLLLGSAHAQNTLVHDSYPRYQASPYPDRIILLPGTQGQLSYQVSWRTSDAVAFAEAEIAKADSSPALAVGATQVSGNTERLIAGNGPAHHHVVEFSGLESNTLYAYRVKGLDSWSEWFQFRTANTENSFPFRILYFGDAQNSVKSLFARVVRQAILSTQQPALVIHAGDMIDRMQNQDNNWGEWFDAVGWLAPSVLQLAVTGNHEYNETVTPPQRVPQWDAQFVSAQNGPSGFEQTVFFTDYQQVRFVVLDSTRAIHDEDAARVQAQWLQQVLANNSESRWTVVIYHHPMMSVSHGVENQMLARHWRPLFEQYGVDLVLQGHDHVYGRDASAVSGGPVYVVSVAGPKMNLVSEAAQAAMSVTGEDVQLFQSIEFSGQQLSYESRTVSGAVYDSFMLQRLPDGSKTLIETHGEQHPSLRSDCNNANAVPSQTDAAGTARPGRCWDGVIWPQAID